jgi:hypothetical protein
VDADATYRMSGQEFSYDELIAALDAEAATLDPDQWVGGWDAHEYLIEALLVPQRSLLDLMPTRS